MTTIAPPLTPAARPHVLNPDPRRGAVAGLRWRSQRKFPTHTGRRLAGWDHPED